MSQDIDKIKDEASEGILNKPGVSGVACGKKYVDGVPTEDDAIIVFVQKKKSPNTIRAQGVDDDLVPDEIDGIPTDVIEVGEIELQKGYRNKVRPIKPGFSISHGNVTAGTIGGIFKDRDGDVVALSNFHVLADDGKAKLGDIIYQPGTADKRGSLKFNGWTDPIDKHPYIGTLKKFHPINANGSTEQDSAICKIHPKLVDGGYVDLVYPQLGKPLKGFRRPDVGDSVFKCGRTTGFTTSRIIGRNATFVIKYGMGSTKIRNSIVTHAMSKGGDSGSIGIDKDMNAIGLLFAGSRKVTIFNEIQPVVDYYGLELLQGATPEKQVPWTDINWTKATTDGQIHFSDEGVVFEDNANHHCYIEMQGNGSTKYEATLNTGTDKGGTWGPGLALIFPHCQMRLNLRYKGTFGAYFNRGYDISVGKIKPNTTYKLSFENDGKFWRGVAEVPSGIKVTLLEIPLNLTGGDPLFVRVGKMGDNHGPRDHGHTRSKAGDLGICKLLDFTKS